MHIQDLFENPITRGQHALKKSSLVSGYPLCSLCEIVGGGHACCLAVSAHDTPYPFTPFYVRVFWRIIDLSPPWGLGR